MERAQRTLGNIIEIWIHNYKLEQEGKLNEQILDFYTPEKLAFYFL